MLQCSGMNAECFLIRRHFFSSVVNNSKHLLGFENSYVGILFFNHARFWPGDYRQLGIFSKISIIYEKGRGGSLGDEMVGKGEVSQERLTNIVVFVFILLKTISTQ